MSTSSNEQELNAGELLAMDDLLKDNRMMRRKMKTDADKPKRRVPVRVFVKDADEITDMRKKLKELEKMEALYKDRINELEKQVSHFSSFHDSSDPKSDNSSVSPLREANRTHDQSNLSSSDSDCSFEPSIPVRDPFENNLYDRISLPTSSMNSSLRRSSNANRTKLLALYDFIPDADAASKGRLGFKEGDVLMLVDMKSRSGWWTAELHGKTGKIPCNYVEQLDPSTAFKARVIKNFDGQQPGDMSIVRGTLVTVLKKQENGWYLGERGSLTGFIPSGCIERISTPCS